MQEVEKSDNYLNKMVSNSKQVLLKNFLEFKSLICPLKTNEFIIMLSQLDYPLSLNLRYYGRTLLTVKKKIVLNRV